MDIRIVVRNLVVVPVVLCLPSIAMYTGMDVHWSLADFAIAALLLSIISITMTMCTPPTSVAHWRWWVGGSVLVLCAIIWIELAVGLIGTPWAGT